MSLPNTETTETDRPWDVVLWDLDGTIIDSVTEITSALAEMFTQMGRAVPSLEELQSYVGPPLLESLTKRAKFDDAEAWQALEIYRDHYKVTALQSPVFPGVEGLLQRLNDVGVTVALATSKPESMARKVLDTNNLTKYFTVVAGASDDEKLSRKAEIVALALKQLVELGVDTSRSIMIGDRDYDIIGAATNNVPTILVEWGYGSPAEAKDAYATVHSADQLRNLLIG